MIRRVSIFAFGVASYAIFFATFLYAVGFVGNFGVPRTIDGPLQGSLAAAILIDLGLLGLFALQHSVMARRGFKRWLTRFIPEPAERSTYVLASSAALLLLFWQWQPIGGVVWNLESGVARAAAYGVFAIGWATILFCTFLINHFDLFGLRQAWLALRDRPYTPLRFATPSLYRVVRHPLYVGWLLAFWATPTMTATHLLFALATTGYILIAIQLEERDLVHAHGDSYVAYRRRVPMLIPSLPRREEMPVRAPRTA
ncbi:MAG TPA: isoprenylcysteine carboxylmethyltransferase family protein [Candidatus Dormibacteraeota bacterium]|nr:isoprenylcysteine carboxylmethyltransferase family protein [Candidatus Dormibacteraeota bacterium]